MADIKWIKITTEVFDDEKMKIIDKMPARDEILVIWFKLLALAGKVNQNGLLFMNNRIPYTIEMLSAVFYREENTIKMALKVFEHYGMVHIEDNEVIAISNWEKHQNIDGLERVREQTRARVNGFREKQKSIASNVTCNVTVTEGNATDIEQELELDKEEDIKDNEHSLLDPEPVIETNQKSEKEHILELDDFFEVHWMLYHNKKGKSKVSKKAKEETFKLGEEFKRCIERYNAERVGEDIRFSNHGSTFWNGIYTDYLDAVYVPPTKSPPVITTKGNKFHNFKQDMAGMSEAELAVIIERQNEKRKANKQKEIESLN